MRLRRLLAAPLIVLLLAAVAACGDDEVASPFADCSSLSSAGAAPNDLPDLSLPCFTGDTSVSLRALKGPAVINMWASWCGPCRAELPVMQKLSDTGTVTVIGVDTGDSRTDGADFASAKGVTMPTLFDADQKLVHKLERINLPVTVFLDADGKSTTHILPLDAATLAQQVDKLFGVKVAL
ncbi:TlpA disulfide reductase family protein [Actinoplanes sp. NPDC048796]|uniref:TlpA family protein disulfide reductase n=1 Tax=Actinoplanes sp. NPDC048796 TaxID=3155640 RepID=UPI003406FFFB